MIVCGWCVWVNWMWEYDFVDFCVGCVWRRVCECDGWCDVVVVIWCVVRGLL